MKKQKFDYFLSFNNKTHHLGGIDVAKTDSVDSAFPKFIRENLFCLTKQIIDLIDKIDTSHYTKLESIINLLKEEISIISSESMEKEILLNSYINNNIDINKVVIGGINTLILYLIYEGGTIVARERESEKKQLLATKDPNNDLFLLGQRNTLNYLGIELVK